MSPFDLSAVFLLLANVEESINYVLGLASLTVALIAIYLAIHHSRAISEVKDEIQKAQEQTRDNLNETTKVGAQTLEALNLHSMLVENQELSESVDNLADDFAQVLELDDPLLNQRAHQDVTQARNYIHMAAEGHLTIGPEALAADEEIPSALLEVARRGDEFWASSVVSPEFFWARASAYLQLQKDRIDDGVKIKRVFIFNDQEDFEEEHSQQQLLLQVEKGIVVHAVIDPKYTPRDLVALARPTTKEDEGGESSSNHSAEVPDVLYAAEFNVADGRVASIELWSSSAGHKPRVTRIWNTLNGFYDNSSLVRPEDLTAVGTTGLPGGARPVSSETVDPELSR